MSGLLNLLYRNVKNVNDDYGLVLLNGVGFFISIRQLFLNELRSELRTR